MRLTLAFVALFLAACSREAAQPAATAQLASRAPFWRNVTDAPALRLDDPQWQERRWLEKTVRFLRGGEGLRAGENPDEWLKLPHEEIVQKLMQDPRFGAMALDFNMYFLGFKADRVKPNQTFDQTVYSFPSALQSAKELLAGGDYFKLFDLEAPLYMQRIQVFNKTDEEKPLKNFDLFRKRYAEYLASAQTVIDYAKTPDATLKEACSREQTHLNSFLPLIFMGIPLEFILDVMISTPGWYQQMYVDCYSPLTPPANLAEDLEKIQALNAKLFVAAEPYAEDDYKPGLVTQIQPFDLGPLGVHARWLSWGFAQRTALTNSSTNMDRKRAAYVLKRYFCDDLTPVGIEDDPNHGPGQHASQPSCRACHYKLDPMAGYFRTYGNRFKDFSQQRNITFDDNAKIDLQDYVNNWRAPAGKPRTWDVGYVRSVTDESLNDYGSTLDDLHANFRKAPEVKACLVRRMFEYAVGDQQTIDPGYLTDVTKEFAARAARNSSEAFRWLATTAVLSHTFQQQDPEPNQCYDFKNGTDPANAPPCRVAYLLQQNCVTCHKSTADHGSLDLSQWLPGPDGVKTFPHLGADGKPIALRATLANLIDRLTTTDPDDRMPAKGKYMSAQDRQALYLWAQNTLNGLKK